MKLFLHFPTFLPSLEQSAEIFWEFLLFSGNTEISQILNNCLRNSDRLVWQCVGGELVSVEIAIALPTSADRFIIPTDEEL